MNLLEFRKFLVKQSGRYDLVTNSSSYVDAGANYIINRAVRFIEKKIDLSDTPMKVFRNVDENVFKFSRQEFRAILGVRFDDGVRIFLCPRPMVQVEKGKPKGYFLDEKNYVLTPTPDKPYTIEITALEQSTILVEDEDTNFWLTNHSDIVYFGCMYFLEGLYRNETGKKEALNSLEELLMGLEHDSIELALQEFTHITHPKAL